MNWRKWISAFGGLCLATCGNAEVTSPPPDRLRKIVVTPPSGRAYFTHATSDRDKGSMVIIDRPITDYLNGSATHSGIIICRPKDLPPSPLWQQNAAASGDNKPNES
ncbi:MAG: hypothetical protein WCO57_14080 [Verrucomicrobiota bacterium]